MKNIALEELISKLELIEDDEFEEKEIENQVYHFILNETIIIWDMLRLASTVNSLPFKDLDTGEEIARSIIDRAVESALKDNNKTDLETIAFEVENSLEFDDLAEEIREIIANL
jgi:hypothetical protein